MHKKLSQKIGSDQRLDETTEMTDKSDKPSLVDDTVKAIETEIINGCYHPGEHLCEATLAKRFSLSRNTLREAFRTLTKNGLIEYRSNRGVFVTVPDVHTIVDVYNARQIIEVGALRNARLPNDIIKEMDTVVNDAEKLCRAKKWQDVGTADMKFHQLLVSLGNSQRLDRLFLQLTIELRLIFGLVEDLQLLHQPFVAMNREIVECLKKQKPKKAARLLKAYLKHSEHKIMRAYGLIQR